MNHEGSALALRLQGATYQLIGEALGISRQRAQQLLAPNKGVRQWVVRRAGGKCEECGIGLPKGGHIHHRGTTGLTPDDYHDLENLELVCPSCHQKLHYPAKPKRQQKPTYWLPPIVYRQKSPEAWARLFGAPVAESIYPPTDEAANVAQ